MGPSGAVGQPLGARWSTLKVREGEIRFLNADRVRVDTNGESGVSMAQHVSATQRTLLPASSANVAQEWRVQ